MIIVQIVHLSNFLRISDDLNQTFEDMINMSVWEARLRIALDNDFTLMMFDEKNKLILWERIISKHK